MMATMMLRKPAPPSRRNGHSVGSVCRITTALTTRRAANWYPWIRSRLDAMVPPLPAQPAYEVVEAQHLGRDRCRRQGQDHVQDVGPAAELRRRRPPAVQ